MSVRTTTRSVTPATIGLALVAAALMGCSSGGSGGGASGSAYARQSTISSGASERRTGATATRSASRLSAAWRLSSMSWG